MIIGEIKKFNKLFNRKIEEVKFYKIDLVNKRYNRLFFFKKMKVKIKNIC